jgi:hypothetical protein
VEARPGAYRALVVMVAGPSVPQTGLPRWFGEDDQESGMPHQPSAMSWAISSQCPASLVQAERSCTRRQGPHRWDGGVVETLGLLCHGHIALASRLT